MTTKQPQLLIHGYYLQLTCVACPEQYDVYDQSGTQVAYFRLRHGNFTVTVPDVGGSVVYNSSPKGDGIFTQKERLPQLEKAIRAVQKYIANTAVDFEVEY